MSQPIPAPILCVCRLLLLCQCQLGLQCLREEGRSKRLGLLIVSFLLSAGQPKQMQPNRGLCWSRHKITLIGRLNAADGLCIKYFSWCTTNSQWWDGTTTAKQCLARAIILLGGAFKEEQGWLEWILSGAEINCLNFIFPMAQSVLRLPGPVFRWHHSASWSAAKNNHGLSVLAYL